MNQHRHFQEGPMFKSLSLKKLVCSTLITIFASTPLIAVSCEYPQNFKIHNSYVIVMKDGSKVTGTVQQANGNCMVTVRQFDGKVVTINFNDVKSFRPARD